MPDYWPVYVYGIAQLRSTPVVPLVSAESTATNTGRTARAAASAGTVHLGGHLLRLGANTAAEGTGKISKVTGIETRWMPAERQVWFVCVCNGEEMPVVSVAVK